MKHWIIVFFLLALTVCASAAELKTVEVTGEADFGEDRTKTEARAIAINNALRSALEEAVGTAVRSQAVVYNSDLISDFVATATKGIVVKQEIVSEGNEIKPDKRLCYCVKMKVTVKPLAGEKKATLKVVKASIRRADGKSDMKAPVFHTKDEMRIMAQVNEDAYVQIFSVDQNGAITKLFPNAYSSKNLIAPEKEFIFPDDALRMMGLKLRVHPLKGHKKNVETVLIIATKEKVPLLDDKSVETPMLADLMRELTEKVDQDKWAQKVLGYEVRE